MSSLDDRVEAFTAANRSFAFILMSAAVYAGIVGLGASDSLRHLIDVPLVTLCWACALPFAAICATTALYYTFGHRNRWYAWADEIETWTVATSLVVLIHASQGNLLFWALYAGYILLVAQAPHQHYTLGAISIAHVIPTVVLFTRNGHHWQAGAMMMIDGVGLAAACDGALRARRLARLENEAVARRREAELERLLEERTRIARELHDGMAGQLHALTARIALLQLQSPVEDEDESSRRNVELSGLRELSQRSSHDLRSIVWAYGESERSSTDALAYVHQRCVEICPEDVEVHFETRVTEFMLAGDTCLHLLRIVQEAMWNALRHGQARRLILRAADSNEGLVVELEDDGRSIHKPVTTSGNGLTNMRKRANAHGGSVSLTPNPDRPGCTLRLVLPRTAPR